MEEGRRKMMKGRNEQSGTVGKKKQMMMDFETKKKELRRWNWDGE